MNAEEKRENRLRLLEDEIGRKLRESQANGELASAPSYGKPLNLGDGYDETPAELRMGMKILKDAGVVPPEVELMQQIEAQRLRAEAAPDEASARAERQKLSEMRQRLALRLEKLRGTGSL
jgi:Domain of unknown function (DUF1992)